MKMAKKLTSDVAFLENITLGLSDALANVPRICDVVCEKREPCEKSQVMAWEQRHGVYLPEDMKKFYLSTDGLLLQWSYQYAANDIRRVGFIHVPHLMQVTLLREKVESNMIYSGSETLLNNKSSNSSLTTSSATIICASSTSTNSTIAIAKDQWGNPTPLIGPKTKIFEVNVINGIAKVCLIYDTTGTNNPKVYLLEMEDLKWVLLAETFSEYLRMAVAHLGLPYWELCFASCSLPSWTEQLFLLLAPHLLEEREPRRSKNIEPVSEHPHNTLDPNIFRFKIKTNVGRSNAAKR